MKTIKKTNATKGALAKKYRNNFLKSHKTAR